MLPRKHAQHQPLKRQLSEQEQEQQALVIELLTIVDDIKAAYKLFTAGSSWIKFVISLANSIKKIERVAKKLKNLTSH